MHPHDLHGTLCFHPLPPGVYSNAQAYGPQTQWGQSFESTPDQPRWADVQTVHPNLTNVIGQHTLFYESTASSSRNDQQMIYQSTMSHAPPMQADVTMFDVERVGVKADHAESTQSHRP
ncbi:hypothetical protein FRC07_007462, partial [Ceratobasidium sp. 392]